MENLLLARVDDRLIHGQVMTAWMKLLPAKEIMIVDDKVAKDTFMIQVLTMAAPSGVKVKVFSVKDAAQILKEGLKGPSIMLAKTPLTYQALVNCGVALDEVNIGGMGISGERKTLYKNIAADSAERDALGEFIEKGITVKIQVIPQDKAIDVATVL